MGKIVVGLTGSFGSGCSYIAERGFEQDGYEYVSLARLLREEYGKLNPKVTKPTRQQLQDFGDKLRENDRAYLAKFVVDKINSGPDDGKWVVDSIRNPHEVVCLKSAFTGFYLIAVYADYVLRLSRSQQKNPKITVEDFQRDDARDSGQDEPDYGQRVTDCYVLADAIIVNNGTYRKRSGFSTELGGKYHRLKSLMEGTSAFDPTSVEALMATAFANSLRSSCLRRKVGAVIVDREGHICSSGYNEVPRDNETCLQQGGCYRQEIRDEIKLEITDSLGSEHAEKAMQTVKKRLRNLDYCRALHAEEMAILNLARYGSPTALQEACLYASTYPCNLCANKIAQAGIEKVVYLEPYPMKEAKETLTNAGVSQQPFEGVSFNGYFRFRPEVEM